MTTIENSHNEHLKRDTRGRKFVQYVLNRMQADTGVGARLRRADNPAMEYQSWELLADFGIDLENSMERLPFCSVGAALARAKPEQDGTLGLGRALANCFEDGNHSDQGRARLRRILACSSTEELVSVLRPMLTLIASRGVKLDHALLLDQLLWFSSESHDRIRRKWAQDFYRQNHDKNGGADE